jgi:predicted nucleotidyltransferase
MYTRDDAVTVGMFLMEELADSGACEAIGLFGSLARHGQGNDIDLIIFVSHSNISRRFIMGCTERVSDWEAKTGRKADKEVKTELRRTSVRELFGLDALTPPNLAENCVDILVYPFSYSYSGAVDELKTIGGESNIEATIAKEVLFLNYQARSFVRIE